jgi:hypothetical protein
MNEPMEQAVAIAIESYVHAPRILSVSEVVRQVASVFPDHDRATIAHRVWKSRRNEISIEARAATRTAGHMVRSLYGNGGEIEARQ